MARVIKAGAGGQKPARPATRVVVDAGAKRVIDRALFQAKQDAEHLLMRAEQERQTLLADGKKLAARAREEAMTRGASEAFAAAAGEALAAFRKRADRYGEAADDVRALALEVVRKILGTEPDLGPKDVERILQKGMAQLRARRRLRVQVGAKRLGELSSERPNLMKALQSEPDLVIESVDDVGEGFARVVTEVGGALCAEETALDALSMAVNVREVARAARPATSGNTHVQTSPSGVEALRRSTQESVPDAAVEDVEDDVGDDEDATLNMSPRSNRRAPNTERVDDVEEIVAEEDDDDRTAERKAPRVPTGQVQVNAGANARAATRVVPIDPRSDKRALRSRDASVDSDSTMRHAPLVDASADGSDEEDLDLFTDDAVKSPRKRR